MATGTSIFLLALGAILTFAVDVTVAGLDIATVGIILMIVGVIGIVVSLLWLDRATSPRGRVVEREEPTTRVVEERR